MVVGSRAGSLRAPLRVHARWLPRSVSHDIDDLGAIDLAVISADTRIVVGQVAWPAVCGNRHFTNYLDLLGSQVHGALVEQVRVGVSAMQRQDNLQLLEVWEGVLPRGTIGLHGSCGREARQANSIR